MATKQSRGTPKQGNSSSTPIKNARGRGKSPKAKSPAVAPSVDRTPVKSVGKHAVVVNVAKSSTEERDDSDGDEEGNKNQEVLATPLAHHIDERPFDFDLNLPETPNTGERLRSGAGINSDLNSRRKSFLLRAKDGDYNKHVSFALLAFAFFAIALGPFLKAASPSELANATVGHSSFCEGFNITRALHMESKIQTLTKELSETIESYQLAKKDASDVMSMQQELLLRLTSELESLTEKHTRVIELTQAPEELAHVNIPHSEHVTDMTSLPNLRQQNIFNAIHTRVAALTMKVQQLIGTEQIVREFNQHASTLTQRSIEIEELVHTLETRYKCVECEPCPLVSEVTAHPPTCSAEVCHELLPHLSMNVSCPSLECPICPDCPICEQRIDTPAFGDYINLPMARELVADLVKRTCHSQLDDIKREHTQHIQVLERDLHETLAKDVRIQQLQETERVVRLHNLRKDFALQMSGAQIIHSKTTTTYIPPDWDPVNKTKAYLRSIAESSNNLLSNSAKGILQYESLVPFIETVSDLLGVDRGVGSPYDALTADMTLGSCWPMAGTSGTLAIRLNSKVAITAISIDHIPKNEALNINTAPRNFRVYGSAEELDTPVLLTEGEYSIADGSLYSQTFAFSTRTIPLQYIQFQFLSNHGNKEFTCIYRVRVHGNEGL